MTREEATRRNTMPNELKPNRSGKPDFFSVPTENGKEVLTDG